MNTYHHSPVPVRTTIADVKEVKLQTVSESRGKLVVGEWSREIPFQPKRFFIISEIPPAEVRGEHGHYTEQQFLVALLGVCRLEVDDGSTCKELVLGRSDSGIYIPPLIWTRYSCSTNAILMVLTSGLYDPEDYVRDYAEFARLKAE